MGFLTSLSLDEIRSRGSIKDSDVLRLRRALNDAHTIAPDEAETILSLNQACPIKDPSWSAFFVDALTDFLVHQVAPEGYVVAEKARWLIDRIGRDGRIDSHVELQLLLSVIEAARWSPPSLVRFAMDQVRLAIVSGAGPLRVGQMPEPGTITENEVALVRRILFAFCSDGDVAVTRDEADALIEINKVIAPGKSSPAWTELFVKAVGNAVLSSLGHVVPPREEAIGQGSGAGGPAVLDASLDKRPESAQPSHIACPSLGDLMGRMIVGGSGIVWASLRAQSPEERALARLERQRLEIITRERIDEVEENWLLARLGRDGQLDDNEGALLAFLEREASMLPSSLRDLAARARVAA